ncbi:MAG: hypothetical protein ABI076_03600 [Acidobacteriaceae bacterium]
MSRLNSTVFWGLLWEKYLAIGHDDTAATATIVKTATLDLVTRNMGVLATVEDYNYKTK